MSTPFFVAAATAQNASATTISVGDPATTQEDDLYIAWCSIQDNTTTTTATWDTPAGWTKVTQENSGTAFFSGDGIVVLFYRFRGASAVGDTAFALSSGTAAPIRASIVAYRGVDTTTPLDVTYSAGSHFNAVTNTMTPTPPAITTATDAALVVLLQWFNLDAFPDGAAVAPSGYTLDHSETGSTGRHHNVASKEVVTSGSETPGAWQHTSTATTADSLNITLALRALADAIPTISTATPEPLVDAAAYTITGTNFKPSTIDPTVSWDGVAQTVGTGTDTQIDGTAVLSTRLYGRSGALIVTNSDALVSDGEWEATMSPPSGEAFTDLTETLADSGQRITAVPDLALGDQVHYKNLQDSTATPVAISKLEVKADGSIAIDSTVSLPATFDVRANKNDGEGWSAFAAQTVVTEESKWTSSPLKEPVFVNGEWTISLVTNKTDVRYAVRTGHTLIGSLLLDGQDGVIDANGIIELTGIPTIPDEDIKVELRWTEGTDDRFLLRFGTTEEIV